MEPVKGFRRIILGITVFVFLILPIFVGVAFGSFSLQAYLFFSSFLFAPIIIGLYVGPYRVTKNRAK